MIRELGRVENVTPSEILIRTQVKSGCSGCSHQNHCGTGILSKAFPHRNGLVRITNHGGFKAGDTVELLLPEQTMLKYSLSLYLLPLCALALGAAAGYQLNPDNELLSIGFAVTSSALSFWLLKRLFKRQDLVIQKALTVKEVDNCRL